MRRLQKSFLDYPALLAQNSPRSGLRDRQQARSAPPIRRHPLNLCYVRLKL